MAIAWKTEADNLMIFIVSGKLDVNEMRTAQAEAEASIQQLGRFSTLVLLQDFSGWNSGSGWEDTSYADRHDASMDKMAVVGDGQWRDQVEMFTLKGMRPVEIEYFTDEVAARAWLAE